MENRKASLFDHLGSVSLLPIIILLALISCSTQSPYDEAVELIKQKKYDEAKEVLKSISKDDPSASKAVVGILVCDMGSLYKKGEYEQAYGVLNTTGMEGDRRYYLLNISPSDSLFAHAATLAHLVAGEVVIKEATDYNASFESDPEEYGADSEMMKLSISTVAEGLNVEHREVDYVDDSGQSDSPPYIGSIGLPNLPVAEEWKSEVGELKKKFEKLDNITSEMVGKSIDAKWAREEAENEALVSAMEFSSSSEAAQWLTRGSGIWVQEEPIFAQQMGIYVKIYNIFKIDRYSGRGAITVGTASAESMQDVERNHRTETWILSIDRNTVKFALGSEWSTGEMTRTGENTAVLKSIGNMVRQ